MKFKKVNYLKGVAVLILFSILFLLFFNSISEAAILDANRHKQSRPTVWYSPSVSNYGYTSNYDSGRAYWNSHLLVSITKSSTSENSDRYYIGDSSTAGLLEGMIGYSTTGNLTSSNSY